LTEASPVLSVRGLRVEFATRRGTLVAVDGIDFDIGPGEILGVVGESGAGKSITGTAVIGLIEPPGRAETADRVAVMYAGRIVETGPVDQVIRRSLHPYTHGLMGSIPRLRDARSRLVQIDGAMPRLDAMPPGCAFHPRCREAGPRCATVVPPPTAIGGSAVACLLHAGGVGHG